MHTALLSEILVSYHTTTRRHNAKDCNVNSVVMLNNTFLGLNFNLTESMDTQNGHHPICPYISTVLKLSAADHTSLLFGELYQWSSHGKRVTIRSQLGRQWKPETWQCANVHTASVRHIIFFSAANISFEAN